MVNSSQPEVQNMKFLITVPGSELAICRDTLPRTISTVYVIIEYEIFWIMAPGFTKHDCIEQKTNQSLQAMFVSALLNTQQPVHVKYRNTADLDTLYSI